MRLALAVLSYLLTFAILAPVLFFAVMFLAGPHSSVLPSSLQSVVAVLSLIALFAVPALAARAMWRRRSG